MLPLASCRNDDPLTAPRADISVGPFSLGKAVLCLGPAPAKAGAAPDQLEPSPFRDMYQSGEEGIHHMAMMVDSLEQAYKDVGVRGYELAARAAVPSGLEFAFVDTVASLGHMLEIYEKSDQLLGFYEMVRSASDGWDGSDPVRVLG